MRQKPTVKMFKAIKKRQDDWRFLSLLEEQLISTTDFVIEGGHG